MENRLWYTKPTDTYMEGLPIGNGRIAAMMLGQPGALRVALNHEWMWRGENRFREVEDVSARLAEVREKLLSGDYLAGTTLGNELFGGKGGVSGQRGRVDPYQPVGDLTVELDAGEAADYARELSLEDGVSGVRFVSPAGQICERAYCSMADGVLVLRVTSERPCDVRLKLSRVPDPRCALTVRAGADELRLSGAFEDGIRFSARAIWKTDGACEAEGDTARLRGATDTLVLVQIGTDAKGEPPEAEMSFPEGFDADALYARHAVAFQKARGGAELIVPTPECGLPTDERVARFRAGGDPGIPLLYFEYGRYLMLCGSSGELPLNLQGKWNEDLQPPWESDYHLDINLQMCYWFVETLGMDGAADTLFRLAERYAPNGREVARRLYGCSGVFFPIQTDAWGRMTPESCGWAVWIGAAAWIAHHFWDHWLRTGDIAFLRERAYPFLKDVAAFYEDYLIERDGEFVIVPSQSPENRFAGTGEWPVSLGVNSAMDIELAMEALQNAVSAAETLGVDEKRREAWKDMLARLPKLSVDSQGRLNEFDREREVPEPGHRHLSHLYGLYPGSLFEPGDDLWRAAERSLDDRLSHGGGHTGWSRSWVACLMARLGRADEAWNHLIALIADFATCSLLDLHPPRIFQIDGNMGGTAAVCEMLFQPREDEARLLPALPSQWPDGEAKRLRGFGYEASFAWREGKLASLTLEAKRDLKLLVTAPGFERVFSLKQGETAEVVC